MARLTVEDCIDRVPNRFDLVMLASQRARDIAAGSQLTVERDNDKNPVVALREIAAGSVDVQQLRRALLQGLHRGPEVDEPEEEEMTLISADQAWTGVVQEESPAGAEGMHEEGSTEEGPLPEDEEGEEESAGAEEGPPSPEEGPPSPEEGPPSPEEGPPSPEEAPGFAEGADEG